LAAEPAPVAVAGNGPAASIALAGGQVDEVAVLAPRPDGHHGDSAGPQQGAQLRCR